MGSFRGSIETIDADGTSWQREMRIAGFLNGPQLFEPPKETGDGGSYDVSRPMLHPVSPPFPTGEAASDEVPGGTGLVIRLAVSTHTKKPPRCRQSHGLMKVA